MAPGFSAPGLVFLALPWPELPEHKALWRPRVIVHHYQSLILGNGAYKYAFFIDSLH